ncbi:MAG: Sensor protein, partial [uncultured bacterium]
MALQKTARQQQQTTWVKAKLQEITQEIQKAEQINEFADNLLNKLAPIMEAQVATFYAFDILEESFKLTGAYGLVLKPGHQAHFGRREGLIGQCASEKTIKVISDIPPDYISITAGVADITPEQLLIAPVLASSEEVLAVLEFAAIKKIGTEQQDLLNELLPILGLNLQIIERNQRTKGLLQESQRQTVELAKQSEQIFFDQQEMQRQHDKLLQANADLAGKSREVEATLEKLEEATKVKGIFLANMSHEIRTPMNAVIGMSHLCLKTELTAKQKDYIEKIQQAGFSLLEIINNILDFSKLEDGNMKVRSSLFQLTEFIEKATMECATRARNKRLDFITQIDENIPPSLYGDQSRIAQILHQLLANAVKFTEKGHVKLSIKTQERNNSQIRLRFEIQDTGIGIPQEHLAKLFQPFRQADESSTRQFSGTGIGLALSKRLVEMLGGQMHAQSQQGRGSTFSFDIWCKPGNLSLPQTLSFSIEGVHALVVDDNPVDRQILKEQLDSVGMRVEVCCNGAEALDAITKADACDPFKVVFMDWRLPGVDGIDIIQQIESLVTSSIRPAIILVTAFEIDDVRDQAELAGVKSFLPKPVTPSNLWSSLTKAFGAPVVTLAPTGTSREDGTDLRGMRILLVEDNDLNQQIAKELLQSVGVAVTLADNGKTALELLKSASDPLPYDLVLMDIQ